MFCLPMPHDLMSPLPDQATLLDNLYQVVTPSPHQGQALAVVRRLGEVVGEVVVAEDSDQEDFDDLIVQQVPYRG